MSGLTSLAGKTALVTGGAKRLGAAIIRGLATQGVHCAIHYRSSANAATTLATEISTLGVEAHLIKGDLSKPDEAAKLWNDAVAKLGTVNFLINNASIFPEDTLGELSETSLAENLAVNTLSPVYLARCMAESGQSGAVVNLLDTMVRDYDKKHVSYHLSKKALHDLTRMMAVEYGPRMRVNGVAPGLVLPPEGKDIAYLEGLKHSNALETIGCPEQIAHAVVFLLTNEFITGQTIYIDGGRHLRGSMYE